MTDTAKTPIGQRLRALADEVDRSLYAENDRGGEVRDVLHSLYMDLVGSHIPGDPISGWELPLLQARVSAILESFSDLERQRNTAVEKLRVGDARNAHLSATLSGVQRELYDMRQEMQLRTNQRDTEASIALHLADQLREAREAKEAADSVRDAAVARMRELETRLLGKDGKSDDVDPIVEVVNQGVDVLIKFLGKRG